MGDNGKYNGNYYNIGIAIAVPCIQNPQVLRLIRCLRKGGGTLNVEKHLKGEGPLLQALRGVWDDIPSQYEKQQATCIMAPKGYP